MEEKKDSFFKTAKGVIAGLLIFAGFVGFCMLGFYIAGKLDGSTL